MRAAVAVFMCLHDKSVFVVVCRSGTIVKRHPKIASMKSQRQRGKVHPSKPQRAKRLNEYSGGEVLLQAGTATMLGPCFTPLKK